MFEISIIIVIAFLWVRNNYVYRYQWWVLSDKEFSMSERHARHDNLPSYDKMVWQFWRWSWKKELDKK